MKSKIFETLAKETISDETGSVFDIKLKRRIAQPDAAYICICSVHGRWFVPVPLELWGALKKAGNRLVKKP